MTKEQAGRLLTLAYFLKTRVSVKNFNMESWGENTDGTRPDLKKHQCGTTACALGWASEVFPKEFYFDGDGSFNCTRGGLVGGTCEFFGVSSDCRNDEWEYLFGADNVRTPKEEAAVIEEFVKSKGYVYG